MAKLDMLTPGTCFRYQERPGFWPFKAAMYVHGQVLAREGDIAHLRIYGREDDRGERIIVIGHVPLRLGAVSQPTCRVTKQRPIPADAQKLIGRWVERQSEGRAGAFVSSLQDVVRLVLETLQERPGQGRDLELEAACLKPGPDGGMDVLEIIAVPRRREVTPGF